VIEALVVECPGLISIDTDDVFKTLKLENVPKIFSSPQERDAAFSQDVVIKYQFSRPVRHTDAHVEWQQMLLAGVTVAR